MLARLRIGVLHRMMGVPGVLRRALGQGPRQIDGVALDEHTRLLMRMLSLDPRPTETYPVAEQREAFRLLSTRCSGPTLPAVVSEHSVGPCRVRLYRPRNVASTTTVLWAHGGGFVIGDLDSHDVFCRRMAHECGVVVASLHYRRAPEHPCPAACDDMVRTWRWLRDQSEALGLDPDRIAVGGDSAGGNLAAVASTELGGAPLAQLLLYPTTDAATHYPSQDRFAEGYFLTKAQIAFFEAQYSGSLPPTDVRLSPILADNLGQLPPTLVYTASLDPLLDEGKAYAERLRQEGVEVVDVTGQGMLHGFIAFAGIVPAADRAVSDFLDHCSAILTR